MDRRALLQGAAACGICTVTENRSGWARGFSRAASAEPAAVKAAFAASSKHDALRLLFDEQQPMRHNRIELIAPFVTAPGLVVAVRVKSRLSGTRAIALIVDSPENPLAAYVRLYGASGVFGTRLDLPKTSLISAYVQTNHGVFFASQWVRVAPAGYGV